MPATNGQLLYTDTGPWASPPTPISQRRGKVEDLPASIFAGRWNVSDPANYVLNASNQITRLYDLTGNGNDLVIPSGGIGPTVLVNGIGGVPVMVFGTGVYLVRTGQTSLKSSVNSLFVLVLPDQNSSTNSPEAYFENADTGGHQATTMQVGQAVNAGDENRYQSYFYYLSDRSAQMLACTQDLTSAAIYQNGKSVATDTTTIADRTNATIFSLGRGVATQGQVLNAQIASVDLLNVNASTAQRQWIEGCRLWDAGLQYKIPAGHAYASMPPMTAIAAAQATRRRFASLIAS